MNDYTLVLNPGSSSLKFCVYRQSADKSWEVAGSGQIEGIGASPRLPAKDDHGKVLADTKLDASVYDGYAAIDATESLI
jgi:acetate kinase